MRSAPLRPQTAPARSLLLCPAPGPDLGATPNREINVEKIIHFTDLYNVESKPICSLELFISRARIYESYGVLGPAQLQDVQRDWIWKFSY